MEPERQRIQDDLRGLVQGEVRCDRVFTQMYATDGSIFEIEPLAVIRPRGTSDVVTSVQYAHEHGLAIHPRGAGTGVAGGCLGRGIVMDLSHSMRRIIRLDQDTVRVQAGVVLDVLNRHLRPRGRIFGPDPSGSDVTTMGSVLAVNRGGSHFLRYGSARDRVESMQVVLADGHVAEFSRHACSPSTDDPLTDRREQLVRQITDLLERSQDAITSSTPESLVNCSGYQLHDVLRDGQLDLAKLLVGSEGTLAIVTEATVVTDPLRKHQGVALLFFERLEKAAIAVQEIRRYDISVCDLVDRRLLSLARDADVRYDVLLPRDVEAMLLVEMDGDDLQDLRSRLKQLTHAVCRKKKLAFDCITSLDPSDVDLYSRLIKRVLPALSRLTGSQRPLPFVEDIAVPPAVLPDFLVSVQNLLKRHQVTASLFAHAGHGQLHLRPFLNLGDPDDVECMQRLANDLYHEVLQVKGTVSGEHGNGLSRSWFVRKQYPSLYPCFRELKRLLDPKNVLNPGKITDTESFHLTRFLRSVTAPSDPDASRGGMKELPSADASTPTVELQLNWSQQDVALTARACNGCGGCRTQSESVRMCPIFRFAPAEEASPRAKANLMRSLFTRELHPEQLADDDLKAVADLCIHCHQCRDECPAGVDIPKLMVECKAQYVAINGLPFSDWLLSRTDLLASWVMSLRSLSNLVIANRRLRWLLERLTGIAQGRKLPRLAKRTFLATARRRRLTRPSRIGGQKVLYFTDIYANWFDTQLADALVSVFQHNGVTVYVHPNQLQSGMSLISVGAIDKAKRLATKNVTLLADAVRQGYHIVTAEPSAALCLTREYANMIDDEDVRLIANNTSEACTYLWSLHQQGQLELDLKPLHMTVGYHLPCHTRALGGGSPGEHLLRLIPGLSVRPLDKGCSGMAGAFGLKKSNYRQSLRAGWPLISAIRDPVLQIGATECSNCKMQMEQGTNKPTLHPLKLLALAYGLMPEIAAKLHAQGEELVVT